MFRIFLLAAFLAAPILPVDDAEAQSRQLRRLFNNNDDQLSEYANDPLRHLGLDLSLAEHCEVPVDDSVIQQYVESLGIDYDAETRSAIERHKSVGEIMHRIITDRPESDGSLCNNIEEKLAARGLHLQ